MTDCDILQPDVLSCLMAPFRLMRKGVLLGLRRLPLITDSYCSPRQPPTPCHSKSFRFLCASVLIVAPSMLASSTGVSTVYGYHSVLCLMHFVLSVLLPPIRSSASSVLTFNLVSVFFWQPLQVQQKCHVSSPSLLSVSCSPLVATLGWRLPIAAPFPLRHSLFPSSSMSFFSRSHIIFPLQR